ncbi:hypothetical protein [Paraburkholderia strydomiana]|uniref:Uncharacterized protein n=1 Tax=Paraburkholderia strydomiana TaxID=1245417 RepID=A0ABW9BY56_9BURK
MFDDARMLNVVVVIFAIIGLVAVLGIVGMAVMHVSMMLGMRSCAEAMHLWR